MEDIIVYVFKTGQRTCLQIMQSVIYLPCWWYPVTSFHVLVVRCSALRGCLIHPPLTHCQAARSCLLGDVVHQVFNISPSVSFLTMCLYRLYQGMKLYFEEMIWLYQDGYDELRPVPRGCTTICTGWMFLSVCSTSWRWWSTVVYRP